MQARKIVASNVSGANYVARLYDNPSHRDPSEVVDGEVVRINGAEIATGTRVELSRDEPFDVAADGDEIVVDL